MNKLIIPNHDYSIQDIEVDTLNEEDIKMFINKMMRKLKYSFNFCNAITVIEAENNPISLTDDRYRENYDYILVRKPRNDRKEFLITQFEIHLFEDFWFKKRVKVGNLIFNLNDSLFEQVSYQEMFDKVINQIQWDIEKYYQRFGLLS